MELIADYFMDISESYDLAYQCRLFLRIIVAGVFGGLIGYERKNRSKGAGMRTHAIVAMGAALMMIVSKYGFSDIPSYDASRVAAQIVSGIGFLGAGVIFVKNNSVSGLTTAAGMWATAGVGMAIGSGSYFVGCFSGLLLIFTQILLHDIRFLAKEPYRGLLKLTLLEYDAVMPELLDYFSEQKIKVINVKIGKTKESTKVTVDLLYPAGYDKNNLIIKWSGDKRVEEIGG